MVDIDVITTIIVGFVKVACTLLSMVGKQHLCPEYIGTRADTKSAASSLHPTHMRWNSSKPFFESKFNEFPSFQFNFSKFRFNFSEPDFSIESIDFDSFFNCDKSDEGSGDSAEGGEVEEFAKVQQARLVTAGRLSDAIDGAKLRKVLEKAAQLLDNPIKWKKPFSIDYEIPERFKSRGVINDLSLENFSKYKVNAVEVDDTDLSVKLSLDTLKMDGIYDMDLEIFDSDSKLTGKGPFDIRSDNVDVSMKMSLEEDADSFVSLKDFKLEMKPGALKVNMTGLSGDGKSEAELNELMSGKISARLEMLHSDPEVGEAVKKVAQKYWELLFDGSTIHQINSVMDAISVT
ncbi:unnamed protein product [Bemisia tabaci]|uniref:Uncharacterized protein n=1 Tax=Bemisia tabaci TaxID=7038 RepID=A0A9P0A659_BEMTA|nr:unnamed protein product [Bemisia tabaci]